jgi:hypothetical protein
VTEIITAANGFLIAVLWFDLMHDVLVWPQRREAQMPEEVTEAIATYYRRVTTDASPMGRLVGLVMGVLVVTLVVQAVTGDAEVWVSGVSIPAALVGVGLAMARIFPQAVRLGERRDPQPRQGEIAREIFRAHVLCLAAMVTLLSAQLIHALA